MKYEIKTSEKFSSIKTAFRKWQKEHPNFMTPEIVSLKQVGNFMVAEVSKGTGFEGKPIYGVTLFEYNPLENKFKTLKGKMFHNFDNAQKYLKSIGKVKLKKVM